MSERRVCRTPRRGLAAVGLALAALSATRPAAGQAPLFLVDGETDVRSVGFRFPGSRSLEASELRARIALGGPGFAFGVRSFLGKLPLVPSPTLEPFDPPTLLRDVVRLERFYRDQGYPDVEVSYDVALNTDDNQVRITYVVDEGLPVRLDTVRVVDPEGQPLSSRLPEETLPAWADLEAHLADQRGTPVGVALRSGVLDRVGAWLRDRGYPFPELSLGSETTGDLDGGRRVRLTVTADPGGRMRVGEIRVEGNERLAASVLRREVPLHEGDWYSRARLAEGQSHLFGLDMVRLAVTDTEPDSTSEDRVDVRLRIREGPLRVLSGRVGWGMGSGVSTDATWSHRNFLGGARTLDVTAVARTGYLAPEPSVARRYSLSTSVRQPWLFDYRVEGIARPFVEYRDDLRDESVQFGVELSALYHRGSRRNVSLRYSMTSRHVIEAGASVALDQRAELFDALSALDTLDLDTRVSSFTAVGRWARAPRQEPGPGPDWSVFGSAQVTGPPGWSTVEYGRLVGDVTGLLPLGSHVSVRARLGGGRVFPFGVSVPAPDRSNRLEAYIRLRDAVLMAGGSQDVRGWATDLLGPKAPDITAVDGGTVVSARYLPLGGLARWTGSLQLEAPFPWLGRPHGIHAFLDAGRVWTPDARFLPTDDPLVPDQLGDRVRFGTGFGVSFGTPVGPVQVDLGYKLNPSALDLRPADEVGQALLEDRSVLDVPPRGIQRWHVHLSVGGVS